MNDEFFKEQKNMDPKPEETTQETEVSKVKVGEAEYTQAELDRLIGLGKIGVEAEEKYGVTIDKIWPNHQRTINEKIALETRLKDMESRPQTPVEPTDDQEIAKRAKEELTKLGYVPADEVRKIVNDTVAGFKILDDTNGFLARMSEEGNPQTTTEDLLKHMQETGIRTPEKAYKDMFESELDIIKEKKLSSLKPSGFVTTQSSNAGSKSPAPQKITKDNLQSALEAALTGS